MSYRLAIQNPSADPKYYELAAQELEAAKAEADAGEWGLYQGAVLQIQEDGFPAGWEAVAERVDRPAVGQPEGWHRTLAG